jgi:FKBP-type peptidyl-prolyl cis-trans isomerase
MKQNLILFAIVLVVGLSACTEDKYMDWKIINDHWYAVHKNDAQFTTPSGLQYDTIFTGWKYDPKPNVNSDVKVNYTGKLVDGTVFDSGTAVWLPLSTVVAGWKEGVTKMHLGAKYKFYIPSALGYGTSTSDPKIPANSILIFDIELLEISN